MEFQVTVLGANSAIPAHGRNQTSQLVNIGNNYLLIDCGEASQIQLRKFKLKFSKIDFIFISHLHGDHYFGLMGLISSFHLHKRSRLLTIFGPNGLDEIITVQLKHSNTRLNFPLRFVPTQSDGIQLILEEKNFRVFSFPLKHRLPCTGFLIKEKPGLLNLIKEKLQETHVPIDAINKLRQGRDVLDEAGNIRFAVEEFAHPPKTPRSYAFCSDTVFDPEIVPYLEGVNLLYHEATFGQDEEKRAADTLHSTAAQAGKIASMANVGKLLLGHYSTRYQDLSPLLQEAKAEFPESYLSEEGITYEVE
ncbi:ribonuclease Z [Cecembia lonarensis]|uniref:Ribonuclease Z n=1 Tax=Cecembia lonarensis (strain CCUG 58316 / KCTC 22772 / LW9) TaxID=1225176 RepID=K1KXP9_CECL9|nr:ribonuclease Z [Cecembia lonarensis]EKB48880.1 Ribonuclease BN [Cecembia lonarensis LW9]